MRRTAATIGVVIPTLAADGCVPAVAEFICTQIERSQRYRLKVFALAGAGQIEPRVRLRWPRSWIGRPQTVTRIWRACDFLYYGSSGNELQFRRSTSICELKQAVEQCDLIQVVSHSPAPALAVTGRGKPVILQVATRTIAGASALTRRLTPPSMRHLKAGVADFRDDRALQRVDAVMVESRSMLEYTRQTVDAGKVRVSIAPPGVDCSAFTPLYDRASHLHNGPYFLFVGRFSDQCNDLVLLCEAYALLRARMANAPRLLLAELREWPRAAAAVLQAARISEHVSVLDACRPEQLKSLYREATCLALPSNEERFSMVVMEAMASGIPVVAARCGGSEDIISNGIDGYLVPVNDASTFASHLRMLCFQARNLRMGVRARHSAVSKFSDEIAFRPYLRAYERLLE